MTPTRFRAAIIGAGRMGGTIDDELKGDLTYLHPASHAAAYREIAEVDLVAVSDVDPRRKETFCQRYDLKPEQGYHDYREMITSERPDVLSITTWAIHRPEMISFAAQNGVKGIYAEKALCCSMAEADEILKLCKQHGVALVMGAYGRNHVGNIQARRRIEDGLIGDVQALTYFGGGQVLRDGSHTVDALLYLAGDPEVSSVQGELFTDVSRYDAAENRFVSEEIRRADPRIRWARIQFANGVAAYVVGEVKSMLDCEITGTDGYLRGTGWGAEWIHGRRVPGRYQVYHPEALEVTLGSTTRSCIEDLLEAVKTGMPGRGSAELVHRGTEITLAIAQSHVEGGRPIPLPMNNRAMVVPSA